MTTNTQFLRQEILRYFDRLPDSFLAEVLLFLKFLLFKAEQPLPPETMNQESDPLAALVGTFDSGVSDIAANHDAYLVQLFEQEQHDGASVIH